MFNNKHSNLGSFIISVLALAILFWYTSCSSDMVKIPPRSQTTPQFPPSRFNLAISPKQANRKDIAVHQAINVYESRNELVATLDFLSQGLVHLTQDTTFSAIVSEACLKNAFSSEYKVRLADAAYRYEQKTGCNIVDVMRERSMLLKQNIDWEMYTRMMNGFVLNEVALQPEIYLGFLNDNGDYENDNWDRRSVAFVGYGQMGNWTEIPGWQSSEQGVFRSFIVIEDMYKIPMWDVAVTGEFMKDLSGGDYQTFAIPTAKCYCISCLEGHGDMCHKSANPQGECSCRSGGNCPGNCLDSTH